MQKINLLLVITKLELGGAQKHLLSLARHLDKSKFNIFLFTSQEGMLLSDALSIPGLKVRTSKFLERRINPVKDFLALLEISWFIKNNRIDIVHTHSSKAGILGRWAGILTGTKIILYTVHGWSFHEFQPPAARKFFLFWERLSARFTHRLIVVSDYDRKKGLAWRIGRPTQYRLIRYGINHQEFTAAENPSLKQELGLNNGDLLVGMVACFKPQKSPQDFIRLASLARQAIPKVKFILVGDGLQRRRMQRLVHKLNLKDNVILTGWRRDIPQVLSAIDVFVLTSLWEGLPIAVLEAMASAKPVVATSTGGITEVISQGKSGFLVAPGCIEEMCEKLIALLVDTNLRKSMGANAREALKKNFPSEEETARQTSALYEELCKQKKGALNARPSLEGFN